MAISIRCARIEDVDRVALLFDAYRQFYGQPADLARAREFLRARIEARQSSILFAELDDRMLGFAQLYPLFSSVHTQQAWILNDLYVDAGVRRSGVGTLLLAAASVAARAAGAKALMLETARDNLAARALYRRAGWHEDDTQWYSLPLAGQHALN